MDWGDVLGAIFNFFGKILYYLIWWPISHIFEYLKKLLFDVARGLHNKIVTVLVVIAFSLLVGLIGLLFNSFK